MSIFWPIGDPYLTTNTYEDRVKLQNYEQQKAMVLATGREENSGIL